MIKSGEYAPEHIANLISKFKSVDSDIERYLKEKAISDSNDKKTITYFILDKKETYIKFYFTIAARSVLLMGLTKEERSNLIEDSRKPVSISILIAQLSKDKDNSSDISAEIFWDYIDYVINEQLDFRYPLIYLECKPGWHKEYYNKFGFIELSSDVSKDLITMYKPNRI